MINSVLTVAIYGDNTDRLVKLASKLIPKQNIFLNPDLSIHPDIALITDIQKEGSAEEFDDYIDHLIDSLSQTKDLIIANLSNPHIGEVMKYVLKKSHVICLDPSKSQFNLNLRQSTDKVDGQAVFKLGLALGLKADKIRSLLEES